MASVLELDARTRELAQLSVDGATLCPGVRYTLQVQACMRSEPGMCGTGQIEVARRQDALVALRPQQLHDGEECRRNLAGPQPRGGDLQQLVEVLPVDCEGLRRVGSAAAAALQLHELQVPLCWC